MSTYEYMSEADKLELHPAIVREDASFMAITELDTEREAGIYIPNADAPTVALELLKAAGQESVIIPKAHEEVERLGDELTCGGGPEWAGSSIASNPNWLRNKAANCIAIAEYIENKASHEAEAEKKLQESDA